MRINYYRLYIVNNKTPVAALSYQHAVAIYCKYYDVEEKDVRNVKRVEDFVLCEQIEMDD